MLTKQLLMLGMALVMLSMVGCGHKSPHNYYPEEKILQYSNIGEVKDVLVGDSIIHYQNVKMTEVLDVKVNLTAGASIIPKGEYEKTGEDAKNIYFSHESIKRKRVDTDAPFRLTGIVYFKDSNKITLMFSGDYALWTWNDGFSIKKTQVKEIGEDFMMRSLSYAASKGKLVSFEYKEGRNAQRITHSMDRGNTFKYQGAEVEIIKYDQDMLTCKVLKEFDIFK